MEGEPPRESLQSFWCRVVTTQHTGDRGSGVVACVARTPSRNRRDSLAGRVGSHVIIKTPSTRRGIAIAATTSSSRSLKTLSQHLAHDLSDPTREGVRTPIWSQSPQQDQPVEGPQVLLPVARELCDLGRRACVRERVKPPREALMIMKTASRWRRVKLTPFSQS